MGSTKGTMKRCMGTDNPLVTVVLAIYNPNLNWLNEQLESIDNQDYENLNLLIIDDSSCDVDFYKIKACINDSLKKINYVLNANDKNLGSNRTFELLTERVTGEYVAFCDQDDIWKYNKISSLIEAIQNSNSMVAYSDMSVIDGNNNITFNSLSKARPRLKYYSGDGLTYKYLFENCTAGCSMIVKSEIAKKAMPFPKDTICDQWICCVASLYGKIVYVNEVLVNYRIHGGNQTGILSGISSKSDYNEKRFVPLKNRILALNNYRINYKYKKNVNKFLDASINNSITEMLMQGLFFTRRTYFEIIAVLLPDRLFAYIIKKIRGVKQ